MSEAHYYVDIDKAYSTFDPGQSKHGRIRGKVGALPYFRD